MTVRELIAKLQTMPPDLPAVGYNGDDYPEEIDSAEVQTSTYWPASGSPKVGQYVKVE